ncbi:hypothetical protein EC957_011849 [Mortierella hygrophila]|uniref:Uncharacterized protein n=1 Tax=Mortierella hygrophila TaxID=979708 RepID=A0A9P6JXE1_9FUNG|nr:hypothetical protein EC957_011849 [Mortierella hygrophila]
MAPGVQETVRASSDIYQAFAKAIKDSHGELSRVELSQELSGHFQKLEVMVTKNTELQEAMNAKQEEMERLQKQVLDNQKEMKQPQKRALDQLAVLQSRVRAVLTQTYELYEHPIPQHTKTTNSKTKIPHHIHIAKHKGYEIARPSEFFQQYGSYILMILKMLKFGQLLYRSCFLIGAESIDQVTAALKQLQEHLEIGVDRVIGHIDNVLARDDGAFEANDEQARSKEALEGADLRKLDTFLKDKDGNKVLGNLYRTVTDEGHVK